MTSGFSGLEPDEELVTHGDLEAAIEDTIQTGEPPRRRRRRRGPPPVPRPFDLGTGPLGGQGGVSWQLVRLHPNYATYGPLYEPMTEDEIAGYGPGTYDVVEYREDAKKPGQRKRMPEPRRVWITDEDLVRLGLRNPTPEPAPAPAGKEQDIGMAMHLASTLARVEERMDRMGRGGQEGAQPWAAPNGATMVPSDVVDQVRRDADQRVAAITRDSEERHESHRRAAEAREEGIRQGYDGRLQIERGRVEDLEGRLRRAESESDDLRRRSEDLDRNLLGAREEATDARNKCRDLERDIKDQVTRGEITSRHAEEDQRRQASEHRSEIRRMEQQSEDARREAQDARAKVQSIPEQLEQQATDFDAVKTWAMRMTGEGPDEPASEAQKTIGLLRDTASVLGDTLRGWQERGQPQAASRAPAGAAPPAAPQLPVPPTGPPAPLAAGTNPPAGASEGLVTLVAALDQHFQGGKTPEETWASLSPWIPPDALAAAAKTPPASFVSDMYAGAAPASTLRGLKGKAWLIEVHAAMIVGTSPP